jgi:hypothetical protein
LRVYPRHSPSMDPYADLLFALGEFAVIVTAKLPHENRPSINYSPLVRAPSVRFLIFFPMLRFRRKPRRRG